MRFLQRSRLFVCGLLTVVGLIVAAGSGCQLGPDLGPAPDPFYPKDMFKLFPSKPPKEYSMSEEAAALRTAKADQAERAK